VVIEKQYYSAPYTLIGERVEARWTGSTVELFHKGRRVASHRRSFVLWGWTTADEHRPDLDRTGTALAGSGRRGRGQARGGR
jgi:hypothetical protein